MTKYTSNEQYEKDKAYLIDVFEQEKLWGERVLKIKSPEDSDCNKLIDLLKQSEWIGAVNQPINQPCTLLKNVDTTTIPN